MKRKHLNVAVLTATGATLTEECTELVRTSLNVEYIKCVGGRALHDIDKWESLPIEAVVVHLSNGNLGFFDGPDMVKEVKEYAHLHKNTMNTYEAACKLYDIMS